MDIDQLQKTVAWLDQERRNDKRTISELQKDIAKLEGMVDKSVNHIKELNSEIAQLSAVVDRVEGFDDALVRHREQVKKELADQEKRLARWKRETIKSRSTEINDLKNNQARIQSELKGLQKLHPEVQERIENEYKINRQIKELDEKLSEIESKDADRDQTLSSMQEELRRIPDIQGEVASLRKRADEQRARLELVIENYGKIEDRISELVAAEDKRLDQQNAFIDKLSVKQSDIEKTLNTMNKSFEEIEQQSNNLQEYLENIGETERAVKRAQESFEAISEQLSRRINEITEMQRLGEERFRQEWSTFKSDDQKRWTNYTLTQEEQHRELSRQIDKITTQTTDLDDKFEEIQDVVQFLGEKSEQRMQALLTSLREWVSENERFMSSVG